MLLLEFYNAAPTDFQDIRDDHSQVRWGETRKTRLTLSAINKIRRMNEVQAYERAENLKHIRKQYAPPVSTGI